MGYHAPMFFFDDCIRLSRRTGCLTLISLAVASLGCAAPGNTVGASSSGPNPELGTFASVTPAVTHERRQPLAPITLHLFVVHVPRQNDSLGPALAQFVRSDSVDAGTLQRLERNGMRFGIGQLETWDTITATIEAIPAHQAFRPDAYRLPPKLPLYLELDETLASRTVFAVGFDGVLNGSNWADSQAVMMVAQQPDLMDPEQVQFSLVPGVRQRRSSAEVGAWPKPVFEEQAFEEAALSLNMAADQYLAVWPSPDAALPQLIGAALFTRVVTDNTAEEKQYNTYVFMRFDLTSLSEASQ